MGKWVLSEQGHPHNIDHFESVMVQAKARLQGYQVRAFLPSNVGGYVSLFSHHSQAVCEEWLQEFTRQNLQLATKIFFNRPCPECDGHGVADGPDGVRLCDQCSGTGSILIDPAEIPAQVEEVV